jgi:hypothetical protein
LKIEIKYGKNGFLFFHTKDNQSPLILDKISKICEKINDIESILYVEYYCSNEVLLNYFKKI